MDTIADSFTRLRNAAKARLETVEMPYSKIVENVLEVLKEEGFVSEVAVQEKGKNRKSLVTKLRFERSGPAVLEHIRRISKPGHRVYSEAPQGDKIRNGLGFQILSTSKGVMTNRKAGAQKVGGEVLGEVW